MEKILISGGIILSFIGVFLMIEASEYIDEKGKKWDHRHNPIKWKVKLSWTLLIVGVAAQIIGIWLPQRIESSLKLEETSLDTANLIIQGQYNLAIFGLTAVIFIAALIAGGSLLYNVYISKHKLEEIKTDIEEKIADKMNNKFEESVIKLTEKTGKVLDVLEKEIRADTAAMISITLETQEKYPMAIATWISSLQLSIDINDGERIGDRAKRLIEALNKCTRGEIRSEIVDKIKKAANDLPPILASQRKEIEDILDELGYSNYKQNRGRR